MNWRGNDLLDRSLQFWIAISKFYLELKEKKYYEVANQIFRSGTSIGANIREAQAAESKQDFVHKLAIALKEALETSYWLDILEQGFNEPNDALKADCLSLIKILTTIIKNTKQNIKNKSS